MESLTFKFIQLFRDNLWDAVKVHQEHEVIWVDSIETVVNENDATAPDFSQIPNHRFDPSCIDAFSPPVRDKCEFFVGVTAVFNEILFRGRFETAAISKKIQK